MGARVLVSAFGSAGDLFPLVPVMQRLQRDGHEVRCAVARALTLPLRIEGISSYALGTGAEMRAFDDPRLVTSRFDGWESWREVVDGYVEPTLAHDVDALDCLMDDWRPDVVVTATFAAAARVAAHRHGVPQVTLTIYPQHLSLLPDSRRYASGFRRAVARQIEAAGGRADPALVARLAWGTSDDCLLLHDPALLERSDEPGNRALVSRAVGFPYFDWRATRPDDPGRASAWLAADGPVVAVTAGSFLGVQRSALWSAVARAAEATGVRALFIGPHRDGDDGADGTAGVARLRVGYLPLSAIAPQVSAVLHHGGVGTMFGVLAAGRPAAVIPHAFDQAHNARLLSRAGVGFAASAAHLERVLARLVNDTTLASQAERMAAALIPTEVAVDRVVDRILSEARVAVGEAELVR